MESLLKSHNANESIIGIRRRVYVSLNVVNIRTSLRSNKATL